MDFVEWLRAHDWETWLGLGIVLVIAEMFSLDLVLLMLASGALVGMVLALVGAGVGIQIIAAVAASVAALAVVRPSIARRLHGGPDLQHGHQKLIGSQGVVTEEMSSLKPGRIRLAGETWTAQPYDGTLVIAEGETVEVLDIRGATAYVHPLPALDPPALGT